MRTNCNCAPTAPEQTLQLKALGQCKHADPNGSEQSGADVPSRLTARCWMQRAEAGRYQVHLESQPWRSGSTGTFFPGASWEENKRSHCSEKPTHCNEEQPSFFFFFILHYFTLFCPQLLVCASW